MKSYILILIIILSAYESYVYGQNKGFIETFDGGNVPQNWSVTGTTFSLSNDNNAMKILYNRTGAAGTEWDQFNITFDPTVDISGNPYISIEIKSDFITKLNVKPVNISENSDWLDKMIPADNQWHTYVFTVSKSQDKPLKSIYFYFDGGSNAKATGSVYFDNLKMGSEATAPVLVADTSKLAKAIRFGLILVKNITEGTAEGNLAIGSKNKITQAISKVQPILNQDLTKTSQKDVDDAEYAVNSACMEAESNVVLNDNPLIDKNATWQTVNLFKNLKDIATKAFLFGMHDATSYGINQDGSNWWDDGASDRSDVKTVCGSHPALFSFDLADVIEGGKPDELNKRISVAYNLDGVITLCWHQDNPNGGDSWTTQPEVVSTILPGGLNYLNYKKKLDKVAAFCKSLRGKNGESIPILFRPYHEQSGDWFWWGRTRCTVSNYNKLWQTTLQYLKDTMNLHNLIYVQSPDGQQLKDPKNYLDIYPGDEYVDVIGLDFYFGAGDSNEISKLSNELKYNSNYATSRNKLAALCESGDRLYWEKDGAPDALLIPNWYTRCFLGAIKNAGFNIGFAAVWRNGSTTHHFAPYPGHSSIPDFLSFYNDPATIFLDNLPDFYNTVNEPVSVFTISDGENIVYPNPFHGQINIKSSYNIGSIAVYDLTGKKIMDIEGQQSKNQTINLSNLKKGVYLFRIYSMKKDFVLTRKVILN